MLIFRFFFCIGSASILALSFDPWDVSRVGPDGGCFGSESPVPTRGFPFLVAAFVRFFEDVSGSASESSAGALRLRGDLGAGASSPSSSSRTSTALVFPFGCAVTFSVAFALPFPFLVFGGGSISSISLSSTTGDILFCFRVGFTGACASWKSSASLSEVVPFFRRAGGLTRLATSPSTSTSESVGGVGFFDREGLEGWVMTGSAFRRSSSFRRILSSS